MTTYRTLPDGNILVHVPMRLVRKQSGVRLLATEPGANMSRNEEMLNIQSLALGLKYRRRRWRRASSRTSRSSGYSRYRHRSGRNSIGSSVSSDGCT